MFIWIIAIFVWMYLIPFLIFGLILFFPVFVCVTPLLFMIGVMQYFFNREYLSGIDYKWWFGQAPAIQLQEKSLICFHPHGILCTAAIVCIHLKNPTKFAVAPILLHMPIVGLFAKNLGCIEATEIEICNALKSHSVILCPGGIPEMVTQKPYTRRHGFLRIAQKMNVPILPVLCKTKFYDVIPMPFKSFRMKIARLGIPIMFPPLGWYGTWLPKRRPIEIEIKKQFVVQGNIEEQRQKYFLQFKY